MEDIKSTISLSVSLIVKEPGLRKDDLDHYALYVEDGMMNPKVESYRSVTLDKASTILIALELIGQLMGMNLQN
jgi:hypothetical protein